MAEITGGVDVGLEVAETQRRSDITIAAAEERPPRSATPAPAAAAGQSSAAPGAGSSADAEMEAGVAAAGVPSAAKLAEINAAYDRQTDPAWDHYRKGFGKAADAANSHLRVSMPPLLWSKRRR